MEFLINRNGDNYVRICFQTSRVLISEIIRMVNFLTGLFIKYIHVFSLIQIAMGNKWLIEKKIIVA